MCPAKVVKSMHPRMHIPTFICVVSLSLGVLAKYLEIPTTGHWDGDDGPWSTFELQLGQPAQAMRLLPSTGGLGVMPFDHSFCNTTTCNNQFGPGFATDASTTWVPKGASRATLNVLYSTWNYNAPSSYGLDRLGIMNGGSWVDLLSSTMMAAMSNVTGFSAGMFGVFVNNYTLAQSDQQQSLLSGLVQNGTINVHGWSYTAGAAELNQTGSFVFGGYDESRFDPSTTLHVFKNITNAEQLNVSLNVITDPDVAQGASLVTSKINILISSDTPQIWLPQDICRQFEAVYGLQWDNSSSLYLLNDTKHAELLQRNATVSFVIAPNATASDLVTIRLPYALMDQTINVNGTMRRYYPIKRASPSQYTLGRTFLQAAHLIVNYDDSSFRISPALSPGNASPILRSIVPDIVQRGLTTGAIAGITVGLVLGFALIVAGVVIFRRRRRQAEAPPLAPVPEETLLHESYKPELASTPIGAPPAYRRRQFSSVSVSSEVDGIDTMLASRIDCLPGISEAAEKKTPVEADPVELEGSTPARVELDSGIKEVEEDAKKSVEADTTYTRADASGEE